MNARGRYEATLAFLSGWPRRVLAIICLVLAGLAAVHRPPPTRADSTETVLVAARTLGAGSVLSLSDIRAQKWPRTIMPLSALRNTSEALGRAIGAPMARGEPLTAARMLDMAIASALAPTQVATTIRLPDEGQAAILQPGALIDLYGAATDGVISDGRSLSGQMASQAVAPGARVLAVVTSDHRNSTGLTVVVAIDRAVASRLANSLSGPFVATLRPPE